VESLLAALGLVFVAELGDKTQLVALGFGARHRLAPVLTGVVGAYMATNLLAVIVGGLLGATLPTRAIGLVGGALFLGFAAKALLDGDDADDEGVVATDDRSVMWSVAGAMFVAELGDKTMLATATLAAQGNPVITWVRRHGRHHPERDPRRAAGSRVRRPPPRPGHPHRVRRPVRGVRPGADRGQRVTRRRSEPSSRAPVQRRQIGPVFAPRCTRRGGTTTGSDMAGRASVW
jgi:putative Ca2+/H+ antiporter (TMEM165/GDT1 family)